MDAQEVAQTIGEAQAGHGRAYERLVDEYGPRIYGYVYRLVGDQHEAEDLLQEVFVRLVRRLDSYRHEDNFDGWLFRIATNLVRDRVRRRARRPAFASLGGCDGDCDDMLANIEAGEGEPSDALERREQIDRLQRALGQLSADEREVVMLRHFSQLSFKEIAKVLGCPLGTALAKAHRTLGKLRKLMEASES